MRTATRESYQERINRVLGYIAQRLDAQLPLEELSQVACFSPYHFHRIFRGMVGEPVKEHVRRLRLKRAAERLREGGDPVTDVAFDAGYQTHESFTRAFRAMVGEAPSSFRENRRELRRQAAQPAHAVESLAVHIERFGLTRLAFVHRIGPYGEVGRAWQKLYAWAGRNGLLGPSAESVGIVHDDPDITPPERLRYDAALVVSERVKPAGEVGILEVPPAEYAVTMHQGPYETLSETYARLCGGWLPASGREARNAPSIEIYHNLPQTTPPAERLTGIHVPLED
jgi:AraC family transcriptional regulator